MLAHSEPYYSQEAVISIELMLALFIVVVIIIFGLLRRRFKTLALFFLVLNILSALNAYLTIEVDMIRGL